MRPIRTLIVDDEPLGRERIRTLLLPEADIEVIGECQDGPKAVAAILQLHPDLVFLDIQMPEMDGFEVVRAVGVVQMPAVIFVTAYDQYAVRAFEVHALDYLLKPFRIDRFGDALRRAVDLIERSQHDLLQTKMAGLLEDLRPVSSPLKRLMIKTHQRMYFIRTEEIDWIEAAGNYVRLYVDGKTHILRQTMTALERCLDESRFLRIHRSTIVNLDRVCEISRQFNGEYAVHLHNGTQLTLSRGYRSQLDRFLV